MPADLLDLLLLASALGCALTGGAFFAFSTFVMTALGRLPPPAGIAAMQSINIVVINPAFLTALFGPALGCLILGVAALLADVGDRGPWLLTGTTLYLVGTIGVTIAFNVPRNEALAKADPQTATAAALWSAYLRDWTMWNHVRTAAALAAATALTVAFRL